MEDKLRKSRVLLNKLATMVTPDIVGNQKQFFMLHRLILKVKKFQFHTPKRFSTAVKNIFFLGGGGEDAPVSNRVTFRSQRTQKKELFSQETDGSINLRYESLVIVE